VQSMCICPVSAVGSLSIRGYDKIASNWYSKGGKILMQKQANEHCSESLIYIHNSAERK